MIDFKRFTTKEYFTLFLILIIPAILKEMSYYETYYVTGTLPTTDPAIRLLFFSNNFFALILGEAVIAALAALLYFMKYDWLKFAAFGYLIRSVTEILASMYTQMTGAMFLPSFILRDAILPLFLLGFLMLWTFKDIKRVWRPVYLIISALIIIQFFVI